MGRWAMRGAPGARAARALALAGALLMPPLAAGAADLKVVAEGLRSADGLVQVAVCPRESFTKRTCPWTGSAPAGQPVTVRGVPAGIYAVQAIHDENANGDLDRPAFGYPTEGLGFSRDARMRMGPPRFDDAALDVKEPGGTVRLTMRYFQ